jgi:hypothetical protein
MSRAQKAIWFCFGLSFLPLLHSTKTLSPVPNRSWLINAIHALYATSALVVRTPKNDAILSGIFNDGSEKSDRSSAPRFTVDSDVDLMQWATEIPSDWQLSGKCSAYLFGCSAHGELADGGRSQLKLTYFKF